MNQHNKSCRIKEEATGVLEQISEDTGLSEAQIVSEMLVEYEDDYRKMKAQAIAGGIE